MIHIIHNQVHITVSCVIGGITIHFSLDNTIHVEFVAIGYFWGG